MTNKYGVDYARHLLKKYYGLSEIKTLKEFETGWANYSFYVETKKEKLVIQIIGETPNPKLLKNLRLQVKLLNYLNEKESAYRVPHIIKNLKGNQLSQDKERYFLVYEYIEGNILDKFNQENFKEYAKAVALFTRDLDKFPFKNKKDPFDTKWLKLEFEKISKIKPRNELDTLVISNIKIIENILNRVDKIKNLGRLRIIHADFNRTNVLFDRNKLTGIIDFHNLEIAPITKEIGVAISRNNFLKKGYSKVKEKIFLKEFEKYYKITNQEKESIIPVILRDNCAVIWWKYLHMEKNRDTAYNQIHSLLKDTNKLYKIWKNIR